MNYLLFFVALAGLVVNFEAFIAEGELSEKWSTGDQAGIAIRDQLFSNLFDSYKRENYAENTTVQVGVTLADVIFDKQNDIMDSRVWLQLSWTDNRFAWNEAEFPVSVLRVPAEKIWRPDVFLYNSHLRAKPSLNCYAANALVYPNGKIWWEPACRLQTYCNLTLASAPYDEQTCAMRFGSRTFDGAMMGLELWEQGNSTLADVSYFINQKYRITKNEAIKEEEFYGCYMEPCHTVLFTLGFQRVFEGGPTCANH